MRHQSYSLDMQGWCNFGRLYQCAVMLLESRIPRPIVVEVGVWKGTSICELAKLLVASYKREFLLYAVDQWSMEHCGTDYALDNIRETMSCEGLDLFEQYRANLRHMNVSHLIRDIREDSAKAASIFHDGTCDFVFIDADHSPQSVHDDVMAWYPKAKMMAGHDIHLPTVKRGLEWSGIEYYECPAVDCWTTSKMLASAVNGRIERNPSVGAQASRV